jgi:arsenate reductase (glutaredoxin)
MPKRGEVIIYHNPKCTTSCNVLTMIEEAGVKPTVVEYLKTGWTKQQLKDLFAAAGVTPRRALRTKSKEAEELGLLDPKITSAKLLDAMVANPVLVERPFVTAPKGTRLCRPKDLVKELL